MLKRSARALLLSCLLLLAGAATAGATTVSTTIDEMEMYITHYGFFEEPDDDIPSTVYDIFGGLDTSLELSAPLAQQSFASLPPSACELIQSGSTIKLLPYALKAPAFQTPPPQFLLDALRAHLPPMSDEEFNAGSHAMTVAIIDFQLPDPSEVTGKLKGDHFTTNRRVTFRARLRYGVIHEPSQTAVLLPLTINQTMADIFGVPAPPGQENDPFYYQWGTNMTLSTKNKFEIQDVSDEPPPLAVEWPYGMTSLKLKGKAIEDDGDYAVVGSGHVDEFFSTVPGLLTVVFGTENPGDVTMALREEGVLTSTP